MEANKASVTVFFTLVFLLIVSMVGTMIEVARYQVSQGHTWRTTECGTASLFTEYNRPLYDEYRLFLLEDTGEPFPQVIASYMNDTLNPNVGKTIDMMDGSLLGVEVKNKQYAGDDGGKAIRTEAVRFMKRKLAADAFSQFMKDKKELASYEEEAEQLKEEVDSEKEAAELDISTLELMELVDGVKISSGEVSKADAFVKMIAPGKKSAVELGIYNQTVWKTVSSDIETWEDFLHDKSKHRSKLRKLLEVTEKALDIAENMKEQFTEINHGSDNLQDYYNKMDMLINGEGSAPGIVTILKDNKKVLEASIEAIKNSKNEDIEAELNSLWKNYQVKGLSFDYTGLSEEGGEDNPKDALSDIFDCGVLKLVAKNPNKISKKCVENPDNFAGLYRDNLIEKSSVSDKLSDFMKDDEVDFTGMIGDILSYGEDSFFLDCYMNEFFGHAGQSVGKMKKTLSYELEYILCGEESDFDNLAETAERLLVFRSVTNMGTLLASSAKRNQAYGAALGIVGFTGMEPLIRLTKTIILITWSMVEGLIDVAALLRGNKIPIVKSAEEFQVGIGELLSVSRQMIQTKAKKVETIKGGLDYEQYLLLFLFSTKASTKLYRMMDLIQWNMKGNYSKTFQLASCVYSVDVEGTIQYPAKFFRMPAIEKMLGRTLKQFQHTARIHYEYR